MARKKNSSVKASNGKEYKYYHFGQIVEVYDEETGQFYKKRKYFSGALKKDAEKKRDDYLAYLEELKAELSKTKSEHLAERTFGESLRSYIDNTFLPDSSMKDSSKLRYVNSYLNIFDGQDILNKPVKDVCGEDLQAVFTHSEYAPSSKVAALKLLRNYYKYAASQLIVNDVTRGIIIPRAEKKRQDQNIVVYSDDEMNTLLEKTPLDHRLRFLIVLAIKTGCRIGELVALEYDDIDLASGQIIINKSLSEIAAFKVDGYISRKRNEITTTKSIDSVRTLPISDEIVDEFAIHKKWHKAEMIRLGYRTNHIFTTKSGELYYPSNLRTALKRLCASLGMESKGWHAFRHTYGSDLAAAGVPIQEVCKLMGHSDISVTSKYYVNITSDQKRQAMDALENYRRMKMPKVAN